MKKSIMCLVLVLLARIATASVIDAPHNETNNMGCTACHTYSVWWQYSPVQNDSIPDHGRAQQVNSMCAGCHGVNGSEIGAVTHSDVGMGSLHRQDLGTWSRVCTDCHDPHFQAQLDWQATIPATVTGSGPYLVTGNFALAPTVTGQGTKASPYFSTFQFTPPPGVETVEGELGQ